MVLYIFTKILSSIPAANAIFSLTLILFYTSYGNGSPAEDKLLKVLFTEYNKLSRPVEFQNESVQVFMGIALRQIVQLDEKDEKLITSVWKRIMWYDYRLAWNESEYDGVKEISIPPSKLWIPDIVLYNSIQEELPNSPASGEDGDMFNVVIDSNGHCMHFPLGITISQCEIDIHWFPFDDQFCALEYRTWSNTISKVDLKLVELLDEVGTDADTTWLKQNPQWNVVDSPGFPCEKQCDFARVNCTSVVYIIHLSRRVLYVIFNMIVPCAVISTLTCVAFLLSSGERVGLGITTLLALSVYQIVILDKIPASSEGIPLISIYFMAQFAMTACAIGMMVVADRLHYRAESTKAYTMPAWVHMIIYTLAQPLRITPPSKTHHTTSTSGKRSPAQSQYLDKPSSNNDTNNRDSNRNNGDNKKNDSGNQDDVRLTMKDPSGTATEGQEMGETGEEEHEHEPEQEQERELGDGVKVKPFCRRRWKASADDWAFAATVIDRACFYAFGTTQTVLSICIVVIPLIITRVTYSTNSYIEERDECNW